jgi:transcriptional regulator with XRE-family HTH domain
MLRQKKPGAAETFGEQLRRYRTNRGLSQEQLAEMAGVAPGTISSAELGHGTPRDDTVRRLAKALRLGGVAHPRFMAAAAGRLVPTPPKKTPTAAEYRRATGDVAGPRRRTLQVFLCHSSGDKDTVRKLYARLKREAGIKPWLDEEDLLPGQDWDAEIRNAVRTSDIVIVCLSMGSTTKAGYVQKEIGFALDVAEQQPEGRIFLIPLRLEVCKVPTRVSRWQWVDYFNPAGYDRLMRAIRTRGLTGGGASASRRARRGRATSRM